MHSMLKKSSWLKLSVVVVMILIYYIQSVATVDCTIRGTNCTLCLSDGQCGFCDSCGDHCHQMKTLHSLDNCNDCAQCVPGTLSGPKKGHTCRHEWLVKYQYQDITCNNQ